MVTPQRLGRVIHGGRIQLPTDQPGMAAVQRQGRPAVDDAVAVEPRLGREAGMEILAHGLGFQPGDRAPV